MEAVDRAAGLRDTELIDIPPLANGWLNQTGTDCRGTGMAMSLASSIWRQAWPPYGRRRLLVTGARVTGARETTTGAPSSCARSATFSAASSS